MNACESTPLGRCHRPRRPRATISTAATHPAAATTEATGTVAATVTTPRPGRIGIAAAGVAAVGIAVVVVSGAIALATTAPAAAGELLSAQAPVSFEALITNLRTWIVGLLVGLSTLFVTVGGIRLLAADGDPGEVERAKRSIRNGLLGYALAALAPMIVSALRSLVG